MDKYVHNCKDFILKQWLIFLNDPNHTPKQNHIGKAENSADILPIGEGRTVKER
jgi:hypothetical protein